MQKKTKYKEMIKTNDYTKSGTELHLSDRLMKFVLIEAHGASVTPYQAKSCYAIQNPLAHVVT